MSDNNTNQYSRSDQRAHMTLVINQVQVKLVGASMPAIKAELFDVIREFLDDSSSWIESIQFWVLPNTLDYPLTPSGGQIIRLAGVVDTNNVPQQALMPTLGTVSFLYNYSQSQLMTAGVIKTVDCPPYYGVSSPNDIGRGDPQGLPVVPDWLFPIYGKIIQDGVVGHMMLTPNKSYTDQTNGTRFTMQFRNGVNKARVAALRRNTMGSQAWSYPQTWRTRNQRGGVSTGNNSGFNLF
jgi:hypothetical protein